MYTEGIIALIVFATLNIVSIGWFHWDDRKDSRAKLWYKDPEWWFQTIWLLLCGTCYLILRLILWLKDLIFKKKQ